MPGVFSRLIPTIATAFGVEAFFAAIFVPQQNETYYDLCGSIGWASSALASLYYPALKAKYWDAVPNAVIPALSSFAPRQLLLSAALGIWTARLGYFLAERAIRHGGDSRFDKIKKKPTTFTIYWLMQSVWITTVGLPVFLVNVVPKVAHPPLGPRDYIGLGLLASSFLFEVVADRQKTEWRRAKNNKQHDEQFITSGLWSVSRHPNYLGEIGTWAGIYTLASSSLQTVVYPGGTLALAAISPLFLYGLLRYGSGVPPLERNGDKKYGSNPKWQEYKKNVPIFWPWGSTK
ncbi:hypothetical protein CPB83DRAFT_902537 [Crepidotus variabilis]|uniref:Steroid 5-alpha reductase C-terminal domain-containing protein n=1 Tax=Crepidotus variabilis TaxID=179855 RepID=A0A9P6ES25_9AGAR|nr:hypothetical protein CPB83DRAFT_902537 [Crepidotus variabilis]